jgi:thioredoxin reductase (NADPH)
MKAEQVIIIGAGPSGLATAIQLERNGIHPLVFERAEEGGLLLNANLVENYPGFPTGIAGPELVKLFIQQAHNMNVRVVFEEVIALDYNQGVFQARTAKGDYASQVSVIATGTKPLIIHDLAIPESLKSRIYYEVYPLLNISGQRVVIVGSGDAAFDYGLNLSKKNQVVILNRGDAPKCLPLLWERSQKVTAITYRNKTEVCRLEAGPEKGVTLVCQEPAGELQLYADYLLVAIGRQPRMDCLSERIHCKTQELEQQETMFIIGDVKNGIYRQTSIAVGDGILAAMKIYRCLKET